MTPEEISKMTDEELQFALAEALNWDNLCLRKGVPQGRCLEETPDNPHELLTIPSWPADPAASAELRRLLWDGGVCVVITWCPYYILARAETAEQRWNTRVSFGENPIATECRAVAEAALMVLTEAKP